MPQPLRLVTFVLALLPLWVVAQEQPGVKGAGNAKVPADVAPRSPDAATVSAEQESAVIQFVEQHHRELLELLIYLKEGLPEEYARAIRDLARTRERLALSEKRDPERYQLDLKHWQVESRRQLLTARFQMSQDAELVAKIRECLVEEHQLSLAILKYDRDRLASRLAKLDEQIARQEAAFKSSIDRKMATLMKSADSSAKTKNNVRKPAPTKPTKKPD